MGLSGEQDAVSGDFADGLGHLAAARWAEAVASLQVALRREPTRLAVARAFATACLQAGRAADARQALAEFTVNSPMSAEGWRLAAQLEWKLCRYDDAMAVLARGLERLPNSQALHKQTALFWGARGKLEASARHAGRAEVGPVQQMIATARGEGAPEASPFAKTENSAVTNDWFDRVAQDSRILDGLLGLSGDDADVEMLKGLEFKLAALLESQPHHADRQVVLARLRVKLDMLPAAMLSVQRALRANRGYVDALRLKATILGRMNEPAAAIDVLEGLIARGMDWPDLHFQIAELEKARGRADEARSHLYSAIRLNPRFEQAKQMLERVAA
jgi:tetratricopeptide (TPR) repeat protein